MSSYASSNPAALGSELSAAIGVPCEIGRAASAELNNGVGRVVLIPRTHRVTRPPWQPADGVASAAIWVRFDVEVHGQSFQAAYDLHDAYVREVEKLKSWASAEVEHAGEYRGDDPSTSSFVVTDTTEFVFPVYSERYTTTTISGHKLQGAVADPSGNNAEPIP